MNMNQEFKQLGPSLLFIYFMIGFVIGVVSCMILLTFIRPYLPIEASWVQALVFAPLVTGGFLGQRVSKFGKRYQVPLGQALKLALGITKADS